MADKAIGCYILTGSRDIAVKETQQQVSNRIKAARRDAEEVIYVTFMGPSASGFKSDPWQAHRATIFIAHIEVVKEYT